MLELDMAVALESQGSDRILPKLARHWQSHQELPSVLRGRRRHRSGRTGRRKHQVEAGREERKHPTEHVPGPP